MNWPLSYREGQFTPAEVVEATGLAQTLQRNWRSQGFLPVRTTGQKRFSPRELAVIRLMVTLRKLGWGLPESRVAADEAAASVLFIALTNFEELCVTVEADPGRSARYKTALHWDKDDQCQRAMSGLGEATTHYLLLQGGECTPLPELHDSMTDHTVEAFALVDLQAVASALAAAIPRPLFTLVVPHSFG